MSGSANIMILATTSSQPQPHKITSKGASPPKKSPPTRPESPGGYFTLSDSDGASNLESSSSDDLHHATSPPRSLYKIYKSSHNVVRSSSEPPIDYGRKTPPRPVPPKTRLIEAIDEDAPPRPPPPLSYTSTLPPPVPKKMGTRRSGSLILHQGRKPPPPPLSNTNNKERPLQRVQPLQIQSPSMISMVLNQTNNSNNHQQPRTSHSNMNNNNLKSTLPKYHHQKQSSSSSMSDGDNNSIDGNIAPVMVRKPKEPVTFVKTFQKATASSSLKAERPKQRSVSSASAYGSVKLESTARKKKAASIGSTTANSSSNAHSTEKRLSAPSTASEVAGYMKPTKNAILRQNTDMGPSSSSMTSRPSSSKKANKSPAASSNDENASSLHHSKARRSLSRSSSSVSDKSCSCEDISVSSSVSTKKKKKSSSSSSSNKSKDMNENHHSTSKMKRLKQSVTEGLKRSASEVPRRSPKLRSKANSSNSSPSSKATKAKSQEDGLNDCVKLKNPIQTLIKFYDEGMKTKKEPITTTNNNVKPVVLEEKEAVDPRNSTTTTSTSSCHLSQLSQLSMDKLQSWFTNPMTMNSLDKDLSVTEISILDQYVTDMISFSQGALSEIKSNKNEISNSNISVQDVVSLVDVQRAKIQDVEDITDDPKADHDSKSAKCESIIIEDCKAPSEEDLSKGVFTEVSCAGNVVKTKEQEIVKEAFKPVPSPRVKRKARKEQMLLEHKEKGHQALSLVMKQLNNNNIINVQDASADNDCKQTADKKCKQTDEDQDGLQCLEDLCVQSLQIEKELNGVVGINNIVHTSVSSTKLERKDEDEKVGV